MMLKIKYRDVNIIGGDVQHSVMFVKSFILAENVMILSILNTKVIQPKITKWTDLKSPKSSVCIVIRYKKFLKIAQNV